MFRSKHSPNALLITPTMFLAGSSSKSGSVSYNSLYLGGNQLTMHNEVVHTENEMCSHVRCVGSSNKMSVHTQYLAVVRFVRLEQPIWECWKRC